METNYNLKMLENIPSSFAVVPGKIYWQRNMVCTPCENALDDLLLMF